MKKNKPKVYRVFGRVEYGATAHVEADNMKEAMSKAKEGNVVNLDIEYSTPFRFVAERIESSE